MELQFGNMDHLILTKVIADRSSKVKMKDLHRYADTEKKKEELKILRHTLDFYLEDIKLEKGLTYSVRMRMEKAKTKELKDDYLRDYIIPDLVKKGFFDSHKVKVKKDKKGQEMYQRFQGN